MTSRHDSYRNLARHYDYHRCDWYAATYGPRLLELLREHGHGGGRVLDAGCGTGTLALLLAGTGYRVTGLDLSDSMLEAARAKDPEDRVAWVQGDVTRFEIPGEPFDIITCVGDTLNHLQEAGEWKMAFETLARHLRPGGLLFFDVMTRAGLERLDQYTVTDGPDRALLLGFMFEPSSGRSTMKLTSFKQLPDSGLFERVSETVTEWAQPVDRIRDLLRGAGFAPPERVWPETEDPETSERLTALATRLESA